MRISIIRIIYQFDYRKKRIIIHVPDFIGLMDCVE